MENSASLRGLAQISGIATSYRGWDELERTVSDATLRSVLKARGIAADSPDEIELSIADADRREWRAFLPPVVVTTQGTDTSFSVHVPHGDPVTLALTAETGEDIALTQSGLWVDPREIDGVLVGRATFVVPAGAPLGWHTLRAVTGPDGGSLTEAECTVIVTPARLSTNDRLVGSRRTGLLAQLYSIRSERSWGVGDFADLRDIASISGSEHGFDYVLVNPLHADRPTPPVEASPYLPTTRRFFNPLYIRVEDIPETSYLTADQFAKVANAAAKFAKANTKTDSLDRDRALRRKLRALERVFRVTQSPARKADLVRFREREGSGLEDFALWCALAEKFGPDDPIWQGKAAHPGTEYAAAARKKLRNRIDFHVWLQWICDGQLALAQRTAVESGMDIGIVHDLAVGVHTRGADAWALGDVLASGVTVGAPPDNFNQQGQNWNQPPWNPDRLRELAYVPYRDMLRTVLRHAGGIRVDHILGLFRLWWIPQDAESPGDGTYVRYDHEALIGILALEAERAGAIVVGEDLGVFEPAVQQYLGERGIFGTSILWFEWEDGNPVPPEHYRELCLTSVTTHDLPPTAGYLRGEHIDLRAGLGLLERDVDEERAQDAAKTDAVLDMARSRGLLDEDAGIPATVEALHRLVRRSPSVLLGVALVDAVGEHRIQNQPGTDETQYPNWCIPLADDEGVAVTVESLADHRRVLSLVEALGREES